MEILIAIIIGALICCAIGLLAWGAMALIDVIPILPPFIRTVLRIVVVVIAGLLCIVVLIRAIQGQPLFLMLAADHVLP